MLEDHFGSLLDLALRIRHQDQHQRGPKVYSLHAPEVECIGRGKARSPYEFGCKVSRLPRRSLPPRAGSSCCTPRLCTATRTTAIPSVRSSPISKGSQVSRSVISMATGLSRPQPSDRFKVWISGQVQRVTKAIRREMRRRAAIEPVIGHLKNDHRMRRNHLKGRHGDRINAVLAAAGYNFSLLPGSRSSCAARQFASVLPNRTTYVPGAHDSAYPRRVPLNRKPGSSVQCVT
jgi:IS5 family transposase